MADRYLITGVQLGILLATNRRKAREEIIDEVMEHQHVGTSERDVYVDAAKVKAANIL